MFHMKALGSKRLLTVFAALLLGCSLMISEVDAVNNCFECDDESGDCHNSANWNVQTCSTSLGNPVPCYKHEPSGRRGCASIRGCRYASGLTPSYYDPNRPWIYVLQKFFPAPRDCYSPSVGCMGVYCCRDWDRCNSAPLSAASSAGVLVCSWLAQMLTTL